MSSDTPKVVDVPDTPPEDTTAALPEARPEAKKQPKELALGAKVRATSDKLPEDALTREDWRAASWDALLVAPEVAWHAMEDGVYYTKDEALEMIERFMRRPVEVAEPEREV